MFHLRTPISRRKTRLGIFGGQKVESKALPVLSIPDWLLIWLALDGSRAIKGKTVFVKQMFIVAKEVVPQIFPMFRFYGHRFGPYSKEFEAALQGLIEKGLVSEKVIEELEGFSSDRKRYDYSISQVGEKVAVGLMAKFPPETIQSLLGYKRVLSQMGYIGLLSYVYNTYPNFAEKSEFRIA
jgi:hypothetical protein